MGVSLQFVFKEMDSNGDELLTLLEIKNGFEALDIYVSGEELAILKEGIDTNGDGVVTLEEFVQTMKPPMEIRKEYKKIMENVKINDPIELEEKTLDLHFRNMALDTAVKEKRGEFGISGVKVNESIGKKRNPLEELLSVKVKTLEDTLADKAEKDKGEEDRVH
jgi:hypothetical protein